MSYFYTYLISSLPSLQFGTKPPFSFKEFIIYCQRFIPDADIQILKKLSISGDYSTIVQATLKKWQDFDSTLRNELVKNRAQRMHIDPGRYLRKDRFPEAFITNIAITALRSSSILEAEKILDLARWQALDDFCFGHYFDLDFLIIYCLKLLILERWERINISDKKQVLEEALKVH
ncbi:MAG: DUF2764 family protein [Candidatus Omnitrophota bacterium]